MIIERLDLLAFGRFTGETLDLSASPVRFHLVYGPNESGKSTSLRAIHALLFGIPQRSDDDFLHDYKKMRVGGRLRDAATHEVVECVRKKGQRKTLLSLDEKQEIDPNKLVAMLRGVDGSTFSRQFGLTHQQLVEGGRAIIEGGGDLGEILFAAGAGAATLRSVKQQLEKDRGELFVSRGTSRSLNKLLSRYQELATELRGLRLLPSEYDAKHRQREQAARDAQLLGQRFKDQNLRVQRMRAYAKAQPLIYERQALLKQLAELDATIPLLDEGFSDRRRELESQRLVTEQQLGSHIKQLAELNRRRDEIVIDNAWLEAAPQIKSLLNELGQIQADAQQREEYQRSIDEANRRIDDWIQRLNSSANLQQLTGQEVPEVAAADAAQTESLPLFAGESLSLQASDPIDKRLDRLTLSEPLRAEIEKLATESGGLIERLESANEHVESIQQALKKVTTDLEALPKPPDPTPLNDALAAIGGNPHKLLEAIAKASDETKKAERGVQIALSKLHGFAGDLQQARSLTLPASAIVKGHADRLQQAQEAVQQAAAELAIEVKALEEAQARLFDQRHDLDVPTAEQLEQARTDRDREIDQLRQAATAAQPVPLERIEVLVQHVRRVDQITDRMHVGHDQVIRRKRLAEDLAQAQLRVERAQHKQTDLQQSLTDVQTQWSALWAEIGVTAGTPAAMQQWCTDHAALLDRVSDWEDKLQALASAQEELQRYGGHLRAALHATTETNQQVSPLADSSELLTLHLLATQRRDELQARSLRFAELEKTQQRLEDELSAARIELAKSQRRLERWQDRWAELTAPLSETHQVAPEAINSIIRAVDECRNLRQQRDTAQEQILRARRRRDDYLARARAVGSQLSVPVLDDQYDVAVQELARGVEEQQKRLDARELLSDQIRSLQAEITAAELAKQAADAKLQQLCSEARCERVEDLPAIEQAAQRRRQWESELQAIDRQLRGLAEASSLEAFIEEASQQPADALKVEIEQADLALEQLREAWAEQQRRLGQLEQEVKAMDGSDRAAGVQQEQQNLLAAIRRQANDYARLTIAQEALRRAIEHYRQQHEGPVLALASGFFSQLTAGEYAGLEVDFDDTDKPRLFGVRASVTEPLNDADDGKRPPSETKLAGLSGLPTPKVPAAAMSDGTADALYLALRLASLQVHLDTHAPIPLIVDDCLIQFDDARSAAALQILSELGRRTQVILFTHHQHLIELAQTHLSPDSYHLHRLDKY